MLGTHIPSHSPHPPWGLFWVRSRQPFEKGWDGVPASGLRNIFEKKKYFGQFAPFPSPTPPHPTPPQPLIPVGQNFKPSQSKGAGHGLASPGLLSPFWRQQMTQRIYD